MLSVEQARKIIGENTTHSEHTACVELDHSLGYVLAQDIYAERDYPPFDRITMDGIALSSSAVSEKNKSFKITDMEQAGKPQLTLSSSDVCIEVATGAPLPVDCDVIVPYEELEINDGVANLIAPEKIKADQYIHKQGVDVKKGDKILSIGKQIGVNEITALASNGIAGPIVYKKPTIAIVSTGDELVDVSAVIASHEIRRSNDITLKSVLNAHGFNNVHCYHCQDDQNEIYKTLETVLAEHDVVIVTGGVSKGTFDYIPDCLEQLQVEELFHRVAQRPGKPIWFGKHSDGQLVFGLPGNPVSCLTCLIVYVLPTLYTTSNIKHHIIKKVTLASHTQFQPALTYFCPVIYDELSNSVTVVSHHGSGDFTSLLETDGFIQLPAEVNEFKAGEHFNYYSWN